VFGEWKISSQYSNCGPSCYTDYAALVPVTTLMQDKYLASGVDLGASHILVYSYT
jgi:hypothetical protein